jgi:hypothetical protein
MSSQDQNMYACQCGAKFSSMAELQEHVKEMRDAKDWKTHGQATANT